MKTQWTDKEVKYLKENYSSKSADIIRCSEFLGRTPASVKAKALRLGLASNRIPVTARIKIGNANRKHWKSNKCIECGATIDIRSKRCQPCELRSRAGKGHNWWNGGVTPLYGATFKRLYPVWKFPIMARDNYECQDCGKSSRSLEVHHLRLFTEIRDKVLQANPELSIKNNKLKLAELIVNEHHLEDGITLCRECHEKRHWTKQGEMLEPPNASGEDNQQPSRTNVIKMVVRKVQRLTGEESQADNPDTSALRTKAKVR